MLRAGDRRVLFLLAHPYLQKSRANRAVADAVRDVAGVTVHSLYDLYPYFHIDIDEEKKLLLDHDLLVVQHPFYWYSMPALLKLWLDEVLESGWAYGTGGDKLRGKDFLLSLTIGGPEESYAPAGFNRFPIEVLLAPWEQTVSLCQMKWHKPKLLYRSIRAEEDNLETHALHVRRWIENYCQGAPL